jgi:hypothetical protein
MNTERVKRLFLAGIAALAGLLILLLMVTPLSASPQNAPPPAAPPAATPTPTPEVGVQFPKLPDYVVEGIRVKPSSPVAGITTTIFITISNKGTANASDRSGAFWTDLYIDPRSYPVQLSHDGVYSWQRYNYDMDLTDLPLVLTMTYVFTQAKVYNLYAQVDTDDHVTETNESNNVNTWLEGAAFPLQVSGQYTIATICHQDFQSAVASNMDTTHSYGVIHLGLFRVPMTETLGDEGSGVYTSSVYHPDRRINVVTATLSVTGAVISNSAMQQKPVVVSNEKSTLSTLYAAWVDGRNGGVCNRQIYFNRSTDGGDTWTTGLAGTYTDVRPFTSTANQDNPHMFYLNQGGADNLFLAWEDTRNRPVGTLPCPGEGDADIYLSCSSDGGTTWSTPIDIITGTLSSDLAARQANPSVVASASDNIFVVWEDYRNGDADIYYAHITDCVKSPALNNRVPDPRVPYRPPRGQPRRNPAVYFDSYNDQVYVAWEDWRTPGHPEIYATWTILGTYDWGIDVPIDIDNEGTGYRIQPSIVASTSVQHKEAQIEDPPGSGNFITATADCPVTAIHVAWEEVLSQTQHYLYYNYGLVKRAGYDPYGLCPGVEKCSYPWVNPNDFCFKPPREPFKLHGWTWIADYAYPRDMDKTQMTCRRYDGKREPCVWPIDPPYQTETDPPRQVTLAKTSDNDIIDLCPPNYDLWSGGVYAAWVDPTRVWDEMHDEVFFARILHPFDAQNPPGDITTFQRWTVCGETAADEPINDNAKVYKYRDNMVLYRRPDIPPAGVKKFNPWPVPFKTVISIGPFTSTIWTMGIAWEDNRWDDPLVPLAYRNHDVFFASLGNTPCTDPAGKPYYNCGVYISPVFSPTGALTATWRSIGWYGVTAQGDYLTLQTRIGSNPTPPFEDVAANGWERWAGNPSSFYPNCKPGVMGPGADCEYDASERQIVDAAGNVNPPAQYIQYKVIIRGGRLTALSEVIIRYTTGDVGSSGGVTSTLFLPIILKSTSP